MMRAIDRDRGRDGSGQALAARQVEALKDRLVANKRE